MYVVAPKGAVLCCFASKKLLLLVLLLLGLSILTAFSSVPSSALEMPQDWKDLLTMSAGISCQASFTQRRTRLRVGAFFLPASVNSNGPVISHDWYFLLMLSLNGLFRHLSKGCSTGVKPPGITATSIFRRWRLLFTESVR